MREGCVHQTHGSVRGGAIKNCKNTAVVGFVLSSLVSLVGSALTNKVSEGILVLHMSRASIASLSSSVSLISSLSFSES